MPCPLLEYRAANDDRKFGVARAYCTAIDAFVQPLRADVCNDRYELDHARDCEYYLQHVEGAPDSAESES